MNYFADNTDTVLKFELNEEGYSLYLIFDVNVARKLLRI